MPTYKVQTTFGLETVTADDYEYFDVPVHSDVERKVVLRFMDVEGETVLEIPYERLGGFERVDE